MEELSTALKNPPIPAPVGPIGGTSGLWITFLSAVKSRQCIAVERQSGNYIQANGDKLAKIMQALKAL